MSYGPAPRDSEWLSHHRQRDDPLTDTRAWTRDHLAPSGSNHRMPQSQFNSQDFQRPPPASDGTGPYTWTSMLVGVVKTSASYLHRKLSGMAETPSDPTPAASQGRLAPPFLYPINLSSARQSVDSSPVPKPLLFTASLNESLRQFASPQSHRSGPPNAPGSPSVEQVLRALENTRLFTQAEANAIKQRVDNMTNHPVDVDVENRQPGTRARGSVVHPGGYNRTINFSAVASDRSRSPSVRPYGRRARKRRYEHDYVSEEAIRRGHRPSRGRYPNKRRRLSRQEMVANEKMDELIYGRREQHQPSATRRRKRRATVDSSIGERSKIPRSSLAHSSPRQLKGDRDDDVEMDRKESHGISRLGNGRKSPARRSRSHDRTAEARTPSVERRPTKAAASSGGSDGFAFPQQSHRPYVGGSRPAPPEFAASDAGSATASSDLLVKSRSSVEVLNSTHQGSKQNSMDVDAGDDANSERLEEKSDETDVTMGATGTEKDNDAEQQQKSTPEPPLSATTAKKLSEVSDSFGKPKEKAVKPSISFGSSASTSVSMDDGKTADAKDTVIDLAGEDKDSEKKSSLAKKPKEVPFYVTVMKKRKKRVREVYEKRLNRIWKSFKPDKTGTAGTLLAKYQSDKLHAVYLKVCEKYKLRPYPNFEGNDNEFVPDTMEETADAPEPTAEDGGDKYNPESPGTSLPKFQMRFPTPKKAKKVEVGSMLPSFGSETEAKESEQTNGGPIGSTFKGFGGNVTTTLGFGGGGKEKLDGFSGDKNEFKFEMGPAPTLPAPTLPAPTVEIPVVAQPSFGGIVPSSQFGMGSNTEKSETNGGLTETAPPALSGYNFGDKGETSPAKATKFSFDPTPKKKVDTATTPSSFGGIPPPATSFGLSPIASKTDAKMAGFAFGNGGFTFGGSSESKTTTVVSDAKTTKKNDNPPSIGFGSTTDAKKMKFTTRPFANGTKSVATNGTMPTAFGGGNSSFTGFGGLPANEANGEQGQLNRNSFAMSSPLKKSESAFGNTSTSSSAFPAGGFGATENGFNSGKVGFGTPAPTSTSTSTGPPGFGTGGQTPFNQGGFSFASGGNQNNSGQPSAFGGPSNGFGGAPNFPTSEGFGSQTAPQGSFQFNGGTGGGGLAPANIFGKTNKRGRPIVRAKRRGGR